LRATDPLKKLASLSACHFWMLRDPDASRKLAHVLINLEFTPG
jgi:hypothetical protein